MDINDAVTALAALAQPTRLQTFRLLVQAGPDGMAAGEIARRLEIPANTLSAHLTVLSHAELVTARRSGRSVIYCAGYPAMRELVDYLQKDCCKGFAEHTLTTGGGRAGNRTRC